MGEDKIKKIYKNISIKKNGDGHTVSADEEVKGENTYDPPSIKTNTHNYDRDNYEDALEQYMKYHGTHDYIRRTVKTVSKKKNDGSSTN